MINRNEIIEIAEKIGLLFQSTGQPYNTPQHMRLISKLEKFAQECYDNGVSFGWDQAKEIYEEK